MCDIVGCDEKATWRDEFDGEYCDSCKEFQVREAGEQEERDMWDPI